MAKATTQDRIAASIRSLGSNVFIRAEFDRFGTYRQVSRALSQLTKSGSLVKVGYGVYAKARKSTLSDRPVPVIPLTSIGLEAMKKLGIKADLGKEARALREGKSTQVPMAPILTVGKSRVSRKIALGNRQIIYEKD